MSFPCRPQSGTSAIEFTVVALLLLMAALLLVETARWHMTRQALSLALLEAARAGSTGHANPPVMEAAFERALLPLFQPPGNHGSPRARMRAELLDVSRQTGRPAWRIDVLSPKAAAFMDFRDASLAPDGSPQQPSIPNDYQAAQHARYQARGWPGGRGPQSGQTIFDANTLELRLSYTHRPLVPLVRAILRAMAPRYSASHVAPRSGAATAAADPAGDYSYAVRRAGMLAIKMEIALPMHSDPKQWGRSAVHAAQDRAAHALGSPPPPLRSGHAATSPQASSNWPAVPGLDMAVKSRSEKGRLALASPSLAPAADADPACGVVLCCAR